jgi:hypothetical protein
MTTDPELDRLLTERAATKAIFVKLMSASAKYNYYDACIAYNEYKESLR